MSFPSPKKLPPLFESAPFRVLSPELSAIRTLDFQFSLFSGIALKKKIANLIQFFHRL